MTSITWAELTAVLSGFTTVFGAIITLLIKMWAKKVKEVDVLRTRDIDHQIKNANTMSNNLRSSISIMKSTIDTHNSRLLAFETRMSKLDERIDEACSTIHEETTHLNKKIDDAVRSEIIDLKNQLIYIKTKSQAGKK